MRATRSQPPTRNSKKELAERTSDLARANDEIQRFAHIVTHDLRAPLVNIMGFAGELENSAKELEQVIATASDRDVAPSVRHKVVETVATEIPEAVGFIRSSAKKMDGLSARFLNCRGKAGARLIFSGLIWRNSWWLALTLSNTSCRWRMVGSHSRLAFERLLATDCRLSRSSEICSTTL